MEAARHHPVDILLVDDREENLLALEAVLSGPQYRLNRATSGKEALSFLVHRNAAVILLDVQMPGMDGFETARRLRELPNGRELPIIFLTANFSDDQYVRAGYEVGAVDFMMKPLDVPALRSKVAVFVDLHLKSCKLVEQEKQLARARVRMTEERLRAVMRHSSVMLWSVDAEGVITMCEGKSLHLAPLDPSMLIGQSAYAVFATVPKIEANIRRALRGESFVAELELGGEWYEVHYAPMTGDDGARIGVIGVTTEITLRKRAEMEMRTALQIRDEFLSIASHELKTPLTPLRLQLQLLQRQAHGKADGVFPVQELLPKLKTADAQVIRLAKLVDDLLDVSRMSNRRLTVQREDMDLAEVIREITGRFSEQAALAETPIAVTGPDRLLGRWDRMRMEQVITNLVSNAIKYGGRHPIEVAFSEEESMILISVADRGIGIAPESLDRIFDRFERVAPESEYSGLGLGLYIVRQLVEAHHGRIWVESEVGKGSRFFVLLPRVPSRFVSSENGREGERNRRPREGSL